jgi:hypothetical protein
VDTVLLRYKEGFVLSEILHTPRSVFCKMRSKLWESTAFKSLVDSSLNDFNLPGIAVALIEGDEISVKVQKRSPRKMSQHLSLQSFRVLAFHTSHQHQSPIDRSLTQHPARNRSLQQLSHYLSKTTTSIPMFNGRQKYPPSS